MKKVLLLLWKISLVSLGGMGPLRELKGMPLLHNFQYLVITRFSVNFPDDYRSVNTLKPAKEDTLEIARYMRASSPPATTADILEGQNPKRNRPLRRVRTNDILQEVEMLSLVFPLPHTFEHETHIYSMKISHILSIIPFSWLYRLNQKNLKTDHTEY